MNGQLACAVAIRFHMIFHMSIDYVWVRIWNEFRM